MTSAKSTDTTVKYSVTEAMANHHITSLATLPIGKRPGCLDMLATQQDLTISQLVFQPDWNAQERCSRIIYTTDPQTNKTAFQLSFTSRIITLQQAPRMHRNAHNVQTVRVYSTAVTY